MAAFKRAVHDACSTGDVAEALLALGPQVDVVLEKPADDFAQPSRMAENRSGAQRAERPGDAMPTTSVVQNRETE